MSIDLQDDYVQALDNLSVVLQNSYDRMKLVCAADNNFSYSQTIANRLRAFYIAQSKIKHFLGKKVAQSGSDFFVETILFSLKLFNDVKGLDLEISSERAIQRQRKAIRPDISLWRGSELLAIVECKTQLGWNRGNWEPDFKAREQKLKEVFPKAKIFLVVMSSCNWSGFGEDPDDPKIPKQLFCLMNIWPTELSNPPIAGMLHDPIEKLFDQLLELRASTSSV